MEAAQSGSGGYAGGHRTGFPVIWLPTYLGVIFKYLGQLITESDDDWLTVVVNLRKAWTKWDRMLRIMGQEGENTWVLRIFVNMVIQVVLLFG